MIGLPILRGGLTLFLANIAFIVWSFCFVALYAWLSIGCMLGLADDSIAGLNAMTVSLSVLWLAHLPPIVWRLRRTRFWKAEGGDTRRAAELFLVRLTVYLTGAGLVSTLWIGFPILLLRPCA